MVAMSQARTASHLLADTLLAKRGPLSAFVAARRPDRSWRLIARDLYDATEGKVDLTAETLRQWFAEQPTEAAS